MIRQATKRGSLVYNIKVAKHHSVAIKNVDSYESSVEQLELKKIQKQTTARSRLAKRLHSRNSVGEYTDKAKEILAALGPIKITKICELVRDEHNPKLLDGEKMIAFFFKLHIEEAERVLTSLSRGNNGHVNEKYFIDWIFSETKARAAVVLPSAMGQVVAEEITHIKEVFSDKKVDTATRALIKYGESKMKAYGTKIGREQVNRACEQLAQDTKVTTSESAMNPTIDRTKLITFLTDKMKMQSPNETVDAIFGQEDEEIKKRKLAILLGFDLVGDEEKEQQKCEKEKLAQAEKENAEKEKVAKEKEKVAKEKEKVAKEKEQKVNEAKEKVKQAKEMAAKAKSDIEQLEKEQKEKEKEQKKEKEMKAMAKDKGYGEKYLAQVGRKLREPKIKEYCSKFLIKGSSPKMLSRQKVLAFMTKVKIKHTERVLTALCDGNATCDIAQVDFIRWCGFGPETEKHRAAAKIQALHRGKSVRRKKAPVVVAVAGVGAGKEVAAAATSKQEDQKRKKDSLTKEESKKEQPKKEQPKKEQPKKEQPKQVQRQLSQNEQKLLAYGSNVMKQMGQQFGQEKVMRLCQTLQMDETNLRREKVVDFMTQANVNHPAHVLSALSGSSQGPINRVDFVSWMGYGVKSSVVVPKQIPPQQRSLTKKNSHAGTVLDSGKLRQHGLNALKKVGNKWGKPKVEAFCRTRLISPKSSIMKRSGVLAFFVQIKLQYPEDVLLALLNGDRTGNVESALFVSWCGYKMGTGNITKAQGMEL